MKLVRIQIDMQYEVGDEQSEEVYNRDVSFFNEIRGAFYHWSETDGDPRIPVKFDLRHGIIDKKEEKDD